MTRDPFAVVREALVYLWGYVEDEWTFSGGVRPHQEPTYREALSTLSSLESEVAALRRVRDAAETYVRGHEEYDGHCSFGSAERFVVLNARYHAMRDALDAATSVASEAARGAGPATPGAGEEGEK